MEVVAPGLEGIDSLTEDITAGMSPEEVLRLLDPLGHLDVEVLIDRLNRVIQKWNAEIDEDIELGNVEEAKAAKCRVREGAVTPELLYQEPKYWTPKLHEVMRQHLTSVTPHQIIEISKHVTPQTTVIVWLVRGAKRALKLQVEEGFVSTADLVHLICRLLRNGEKVVLTS